MKVILDIKEKKKVPFFMEMICGLNYVKVVKEIKGSHKTKIVSDLAEAFDNVAEYEQGRKKLKTAKELLNEI